MTLTEMASEVAELNKEKGWRDGNRTFGEYVALLHSEVSESLEAYRDYGLDDATAGWAPVPQAVRPKPEGVGSELADVLIRLLDMSEAFGFDLEVEYRRKMAYNLTRSYRHGGKRL